jgi:outer membrane protein assembly factor BamB
MRASARAIVAGAALMASIIGISGASAASVSPAGWPQEGYNAQHTGDNSQETTLTRSNVAELQRVFHLGIVTAPDPISAGGVVYISRNGDGLVQAVNGTTGVLEWTRNACHEGQETSIPAFAANKIWVGLNDPGTGALSTSGVSIACIEAGDLFLSPPSVANGVVYAGGQNGVVTAISAANAHVLWTTCIHCSPGGAPSLDSPALSSDGRWLFIGASNTGYVYKLDARTGALVWSHYVDSCGASTVTVSGSRLFVSGCNVYALSASSGATLWHSTHFGSTISALAAAGGLVFATAGGNYPGVAAFSASTGAMAWNSLGYQGPTLVAPTVADGVVYVDDGELSSIIMLNSSTGAQISSLQLQYPYSFIGEAIVAGGHLYACATNLSNGATALEGYALPS